MPRQKERCPYPTHGDIHPLYYRDSHGKMVRADSWFACPRCLEEDSVTPMRCLGGLARQVLDDWGLNPQHAKELAQRRADRTAEAPAPTP